MRIFTAIVDAAISDGVGLADTRRKAGKQACLSSEKA
jgi:hypothetical protein